MSSYETSAALEEQVTHHIALHVQSQLSQFYCHLSRRVIILAGPTGIGKTDLSLALAKKLGGEIVSCDSMQVYRGMDIGTAKVSFEERQVVPHHLIDICNVDESFNVFDYFNEAKIAINSILARGKVPILVGGTGFYIHALMYGPPQGPQADPELRKLFEREKEQNGISSLYERLSLLDPEYAKTISHTDVQKIIRGLEIIELSGKKVSDFSWSERSPLSLFDCRAWFLHMPRQELYARLNVRCEEMLDTGLLEEVIELDREGIRNNSTARRAIGYRQTLEFLDTAQSKEDFASYVEKLQTATRHLAKRQFTWFRKEKLFRWVDITETSQDDLLNLIMDDYSQGLSYEGYSSAT
jgi:tRNA dimethylallyltransferase